MNEKEMRARLAEIDERLPQCRNEALTLTEADLGEEEATRFDELVAENKTLAAEREQLAARLAKIDEIRETARNATTEQVGNDDDERVRSAGGRGVETDGGGRSRATRLDPFEGIDYDRSLHAPANDLRARALNAVEQERSHVFDDAAREKVTGLLDRGDKHGRIARHVLLTGSPAYQRAFEMVLEGRQPYQLPEPEMTALRETEEYQRAGMNEGTNSQGGFLVPFYLDPTVMLQNSGSTNPFRQISRVETITTNTWRGLSTAGVSASWLAESTQASRVDPAFAQPTIPAFKAAAYLQASFEVTQDTNIASQVGMLLQDAKDQLEATAFAVGSGTGQPKGVVTAVAAVSGSVINTSATGTVYGAPDVYALAGAIPPRYRSNTSWLASNNIYLLTRQFATGTGPQSAFWADLGMNTPAQLLGRPIYESSAMDSTIAATKNVLMLGDFSNYLIVDRIGMTVQYNPLVIGSSQMPTGEVGWFAHWRVGADCINPAAFRLLKVTTNA
jgi:HK97 family phage major capsid protein